MRTAALLLPAMFATLATLAPPASAQAPAGEPAIARFSTAAGSAPPAPWKLATLPKLPRHTRYTLVELDGARVLRLEADAGSYANLLHPFSPSQPLATLRWRWRADRLPAGADLTRKEADDTAARLCVLFDVPLERLSFGDRTGLRLGRALFDPELPAAAICYLWDARLPAGTWLPNAYTGRVQMLVLRSTAGADATGRWYDESRDLRADFARAFPRESAGGLPPLAAIGVAADGDNTGGSALSFFGDIAAGDGR